MGSKNISPDAHVDYRVFGAVPLEIYLQTKQPSFLELGKSFADKQWETTRRTESPPRPATGSTTCT